MSEPSGWRANPVVQAFAMIGVLLVVAFTYALNFKAANRILALPYSGLTEGALAFTPQATFHAALWTLAFVLLAGLFALAGRFFLKLNIGLTARARPFWIAAFGLVLALWGLSRFDYWAFYPDRLVVQRPWGQTVYPVETVRAVDVGCMEFASGRSSTGYDLVYALDFDGRTFDIARDRDVVLGTSTSDMVDDLTAYQPRLLALGVPYHDIGSTPDCVADYLRTLGPHGPVRLAAIGVR